jgi:penicillin G amidase
VLSPAGAHWCGGDCNALLQSSLADALRDLSARFGSDPATWRWGVAHPANFTHPILRAIPLLNRFATLSIASPGDDSTVDRGGPAYKQFQSVHGAEYRGVYDLADLDRSLFMMAPGQSGNLLSSHARDFLTRWRDGDTITLGPTAATTTATIRLMP